MLGIVIVSYRSDDRTVRFVKDELSRISVPYAVVVVDNGADSHEAGELQNRLAGRATVLPAENGGFAKGNNLGAEWLRENIHPDYILFTNNDIRIESGSVAEVLLACFREHADVGIAGPEVIGLDGRRQSPAPDEGLWDRYVWKYLCTPFLSAKKKRERFRLDYAEKAQEGYCYRVMGSFFMVDADSFFQAGRFDKSTFLYGEEPILSERFLRIGKKCWFCPRVRVIHEHGTVISAHYRRKTASMMDFDSMAIYYRNYKGYSRLSVGLARVLYRLILLVK